MGIATGGFSSPYQQALASVGSSEVKDFVYFMNNEYRGDHDDWPDRMLDAFYKWLAERIEYYRFSAWDNPSTPRVYVDVPFSKKDQFKDEFKARWDPQVKCWYSCPIYVPEFVKACREKLAGFEPIGVFRNGKPENVLDAARFAKKFPNHVPAA